MQLNPKVLADIIGPDQAALASRDLRRRRTPRARVSIHGFLHLIENGISLDPTPVLVSDVSDMGVGFVNRDGLLVGQEFGISIARRDGTLLSLVCCVNRCQHLKDGRFKIGAMFLRESKQPSGDGKRGPAASAEPDAPVDPVLDKRRVRRVNCQAHVQIRICRNGQIAAPISVGMLDFSPRGVGVIHDHPLNCGDQFLMSVRTKTSPNMQMLYTVAHCRATGPDTYLIGAEFTCPALTPT